ncbi:hypothetical protein [Bradyrhizobium zhanjiangense]|uniref:Uncharacterized protein n=1 Tax=Bradyrhizobium zhanjiangense TaxID=1325107 RepID=A0A4V1KUD3_9BRAD|nr:hypothetical protein [Bradyrhizobium zhanjiangense]RXG83840.1 hypothetical protein EAS61_40805 [Bradyrhizobium zhanjiangense]
MSGYLRFCFAGLVFVGTLSSAPASSNPLADIFNTAAPQPAVTSPPQAECLGRPGNSTPDGQHWVYRMDGHRKCWFLTEGTAKVKKTVRRRVAKDSTASLDENGAARPRQSGVVDARAELLRSAPAEPSHPEVKVADAADDLGTGSALMSAAPIAEHGRRPTPAHSVLSQVDVEQLLATAPTVNDAVTSFGPPAVPTGVGIAEARNEAPSQTATWLGALLMMLGMFSILSSSRSLRHAVRIRH